MKNRIRPGELADAAQMAELSALAREAYARHSLVFWRPAPGATEQQRQFFEQQLREQKWLVFIAEQDAVLSGFVTGQLVKAPPVYDPGGPVCMLDDFVVREASAGCRRPGRDRRRGGSRNTLRRLRSARAR